jgi:hypothetical protein
VNLECLEDLLLLRRDLGLMTQEDIHDNSEYETDTEEMTEEILQLLMKHDRKFYDNYERDHREELLPL